MYISNVGIDKINGAVKPEESANFFQKYQFWRVHTSAWLSHVGYFVHIVGSQHGVNTGSQREETNNRNS